MFQKQKAAIYPGMGGKLSFQPVKTRPFNFVFGLDRQQFARDMVLLVAGFLLARTNLLGQMLPFGMAIFLGSFLVRTRRTILVGICVILGTFSLGLERQAFEYGIVFAVFLLLQLVVLKRIQKNYLPYLSMACAFLGVRVVFAAIAGANLYDYLLLCMELALSLSMAFVFGRAVYLLQQPFGRRVLSREEQICLLVISALSLAGTHGWEIWGLSVANIASLCVIMLISYLGGSGTGAVAGATIGMMSSISNFIFPSVVGIYAFSGMLAGVMQDLGKVAVGIAFAFANIVISYFAVESSNFLSLFFETACAFLLFMGMPKRMLSGVAGFVPTAKGEVKVRLNHEKGFKEFLSKRLLGFSEVFQEMSRSFDQVAIAKSEVEENEHVEKLLQTIAKKACRNCFRYQSCWGKEIYKVSQGMLNLLAIAETKEELTVEDMEGELARRCVRQKELVTILNYLLENYKTNYYWQKKVFEGRQIVTNQLMGISDIMRDLSDEVKMDDDFQEEMADRIFAELLKCKCKVYGINVIDLGKERTEIEVTKQPCRGAGECVALVAPTASRLVKHNLVVAHKECGSHRNKRQCHLQLLPLHQLGVETGLAKAAKNGGLVSGDSSSAFCLKDGHFVLMLSDGMGVGPKAAAESSATVGLMENLLRHGFKKELALRVINSTLALRSQGESFATIDLTMIDLFSAEAEFVKVGACMSFIKRGNSIGIIQSRSLPAGILSKPDAEIQRKKLKVGDIVIMITDGVLDSDKEAVNKETWLVNLLKELNTDDPQVIAETILRHAKEKYGENISDDLTVLVGRISHNI